MNPVTYLLERPKNIGGIGEIPSKSDCNNGNVLYGVREPILHSLALGKRRGPKIYHETRIEHLKKGKEVFYHTTNHLEEDDHKLVDFDGETITFTCQLINL